MITAAKEGTTDTVQLWFQSHWSAHISLVCLLKSTKKNDSYNSNIISEGKVLLDCEQKSEHPICGHNVRGEIIYTLSGTLGLFFFFFNVYVTAKKHHTKDYVP